MKKENATLKLLDDDSKSLQDESNLKIADYPKISATSTESQRKYVLKVLELFPSANTIELKNLGIIYPPARIFELKQQGYPIKITRQTFTDHVGVKHQRISRYWLAHGKTKE